MRAAAVSILLLIACGGSSAESPPPQPERHLRRTNDCAGPMAHKCSEPRSLGVAERTPAVEPVPDKTVPDAVEAGPRVYKVALENQQVRVLVADYAPGGKVPMHRHPDHVVFALTGDAAVFQPTGAHEVDGARPTATRVLLVELGVEPGSAVPAGDEPVAKYPRVFRLLVDEARVRVLAVTFGKGRSRPVALGDHVLLSRDKGSLVVEPRGGRAESHELEPGEVLFLPAGVYSAINSKKESFAVVLFELKP